jgi:hypothetical protein
MVWSPSKSSCWVQTVRSCATCAASRDDGVLAVADFQGRQVQLRLVGDEALEAVPVLVAEGELGARVRALAAAAQSGALGPRAEADAAGQLGHPGALARFAVGVERRHLPR